MEAVVAMIFSLAVLMAVVLAALLLRQKQPGFALAAGLAALAVTPPALIFWHKGLTLNGKGAAFPALAAVQGILALAALACVLLAVRGLRKK
ncbi:MAG: hypothetical protein IKO91_06065 [Oscillospiraceae bacterium]|nr:hypothetical protein [Oscillospiraceae bacterium]